MNPQGHLPRVLPDLPPNRVLSSHDYPQDHAPQPSPPPITPRKNHGQHQKSAANYPGNQMSHSAPTNQSADYPGNVPSSRATVADQSSNFSSRAGWSDNNNVDTSHHLHEATPNWNGKGTSSTYGGHTALIHSVKDDRTSKQLQEENHLLRMRVEDHVLDNNKKDRDLQYCQEHIRSLTTQLTQKKEELLKSEERVVNMQADLSEARERILDMQREQSSNNTTGCRPVTSDNEMALRREVAYLQDMLDEERKEKDYCAMQLERERGMWKHKVIEHDEEIQRYQDQMQRMEMELRRGQQQPHHFRPDYVDGDMKSRVEMLEAQVLIYKEDFETEREDRTRAQDTIIKLKEEVASLMQTNELLVNERTQPQPRQR